MTRAEQEIAECLERAYASRLLVDDAMQRLGDSIAQQWRAAADESRSSSTVGTCGGVDEPLPRLCPEVALRHTAGSNPACSTPFTPPPPAVVGKRRGVRRDYLAIACYAVSAVVATVLVIGAVR